LIRIRPFNSAELKEAIGDDGYLRIHEDNHLDYFDGYLQSIGCKWIVIEDKYVDRDFLDDYANYYVKCFRPYERFCKRLHFFQELDTDGFSEYVKTGLGDVDLKTINEGYLGFCVVKPLPVTRFGRTLLATYPDTVTEGPEQNNLRSIRCLDDHTPHIGGIHLSIRSLPFQEQDSVTAACATSAIWSALQCTARRFGYYAPTPYEITKSATVYYQQSRPFPNTGLNVSQICRAIISTGLEPDINEYLDPYTTARVPKNILLANCYGYLRAGLPVIALVTLDGVGDHAITLTGYRIDDSMEPWDEMNAAHQKDYGFFLRGSRISQFYAHDDQFGPFAKIGVGIPSDGGPIKFETSWKDASGPIDVWPFTMVTPVYNKIRIPLTAPLPYIFEIQNIIDPFGTLRANGIIIEWDAFLSEVSSYKQEIFDRDDIKPELKEELMSTPFPRFIWRYRAFCDDEELFEVLADATDFKRSFQLFRTNYFNDEFKASLAERLRNIPPDVLRTPKLHRFLIEGMG
jgi:hypothetical protein